jgi:hypothetical protein
MNYFCLLRFMKDSLIKYILIYQLDAFVLKMSYKNGVIRIRLYWCSMDRNAANTLWSKSFNKFVRNFRSKK